MANEIITHTFFTSGYFPKYMPIEALTNPPTFDGIPDINANRVQIKHPDNSTSNLPDFVKPLIKSRIKI